MAHVVQQLTHRPGQGGDGAHDEGAEEKQDNERDADAGTPGQFTRGGAGKAPAVAPLEPRAQPDGGGKERSQVELPRAGVRVGGGEEATSAQQYGDDDAPD